MTKPDLIFAAIAAHEKASTAFEASGIETGDFDVKLDEVAADLGIKLAKTMPTTIAGCAALLQYADSDNPDGTKFSAMAGDATWTEQLHKTSRRGPQTNRRCLIPGLRVFRRPLGSPGGLFFFQTGRGFAR